MAETVDGAGAWPPYCRPGVDEKWNEPAKDAVAPNQKVEFFVGHGLHPAWPPFLKEHGLEALAHKAYVSLECGRRNIIPAKSEYWFEAFRYFAPEDTQVLILGQDPYPEDYQGLCFSSPVLRPSVQNIIANLENNNLARPHYKNGERHRSGDLRTWALQGVLMLNAALTADRSRPGGSHRAAWKPFIAKLVTAVAARVRAEGRQLLCFLWGRDAQSFAPALVGEGAKVYQWSHPSPNGDNQNPPEKRFIHAPHFVEANALLERKIEWDPLARTLLFTDGGCVGNGKPDALASYGYHFMTGPLRGTQGWGRVAPCEYAWVDPQDITRGFRPQPDRPKAPTNNRGEYLAWCWALLLLLRSGAGGGVEIVSDSQLVIRTITEWLPARRRKNTVSQLKNLDLVYITEALLARLRQVSLGVDITHERSHRPKPPPGSPARKIVLWYGNKLADELAGHPLKADGEMPMRVACPPVRWRLFGE